ncbi:MAG TPA: VOC family protein [Actinomycetota bacterium]|nr:VOC family protein [Actinomycetota bacterium]
MLVWLDHASISVPDLAAAVEHLDRRLGLRATVSPSAPDRHGRVLLHRSYLEVSAGSRDDRWHATMFFLRFDDPDALRAHLDGAGIAHRWGDYAGVDGTWDDVEVRVGDVPLPTLIRRTAPPEIARDWPPALAEPHPCGVHSLAAVHVEVPSFAEALEAYARLLGRDVPLAAGGPARVPLASGHLLLRQGDPGRIVGVVLGVASLDRTRDAVAAPVPEAEDGVAWLDPGDSFGLQLGFAEADVPG